MVEITGAYDRASIIEARALFEEYQQALGVDLSFQGFAAELETLPGEYAPPGGWLLLARDGGDIAGCIAMRPLTGETCEMKRLYVRPRYRAEGVGRQLAERSQARGSSASICDGVPLHGADVPCAGGCRSIEARRASGPYFFFFEAFGL
jgi:GNAT superfamily N-acetyltransferase